MAEPHFTSQPSQPDEEETASGGLLDWQARRTLQPWSVVTAGTLCEVCCGGVCSHSSGSLPRQVQRVHRLLEYRCVRYFYLPAAGSFVAVPPVPSGFTAELNAAADALEATGRASAVEAVQGWDQAERQLRCSAQCTAAASATKPSGLASG